MLSLVSAGALAFLLLVALTACQINAQQTTPPLPQLLDVIRVAGPKDIAIAPNGWAYIISDGGSDGIVSIVVLDGSKIIGRIPWPDNHLPTGEVAQLAIHPITGLVYVIDPWAKLIYVIDKLEVVAVIDTLYALGRIAIHPTSGLVYVTNYTNRPQPGVAPGPGDVAVISGTEVITTVATGGLGPWQIAVDEPRGYIYVTNSNSASVAVFGFAEEIGTPSLWQRFLPFIQR